MEANGLGKLGFMMLAFVYLLQGTTSLFSTAIIQRFGIKAIVTLGAFFLSCLGFSMIFLAYVATFPVEEHVGLKGDIAMTIACIASSALSGIG